MSDLFTPMFGADGLRWSLICVMLLMVPTAVLLGMALNPYRERMAYMSQFSLRSV